MHWQAQAGARDPGLPLAVRLTGTAAAGLKDQKVGLNLNSAFINPSFQATMPP